MCAKRSFLSDDIQTMYNNIDTNPDEWFNGLSNFFSDLRSFFTGAGELKDDFSNLEQYMNNLFEVNDITKEKLDAMLDDVQDVEDSYKKKFDETTDDLFDFRTKLRLHRRLALNNIDVRDIEAAEYNNLLDWYKEIDKAIKNGDTDKLIECLALLISYVENGTLTADAAASLMSGYTLSDTLKTSMVDRLLESCSDGTLTQADAIKLLKVIDSPEELADYPGCYGISSTGWQLRIIGWKSENIDVEQINETLNIFGIVTSEQQRIFFAQCSHESGLGSTLKEIDPIEENISGGLGYKGAGYIQLTHNYNYEALYDYLKSQGIDDPRIKNGDGDKTPCDIVAENYAWLASGFWWYDNNVSELVNDGYTNVQIGRLIHRGSANSTNKAWGEQERIEFYNDLEGVF